MSDNVDVYRVTPPFFNELLTRIQLTILIQFECVCFSVTFNTMLFCKVFSFIAVHIFPLFRAVFEKTLGLLTQRLLLVTCQYP